MVVNFWGEKTTQKYETRRRRGKKEKRNKIRAVQRCADRLQVFSYFDIFEFFFCLVSKTDSFRETKKTATIIARWLNQFLISRNYLSNLENMVLPCVLSCQSTSCQTLFLLSSCIVLFFQKNCKSSLFVDIVIC